MKALIASLVNKPWAQHILAAVNRYTSRLGPLFAAAVTYFSILSMVPVLMFGISALGYTLNVLRPDLLEPVMQAIRDAVGSGEAGDTVGEAVDTVLSQWRSFTVLAILTAAYTGSKWVGNLKRALRVMWRDKFSQASEKRNFVLELLENLVIFLGLLICVVVAIGLTVVGTQLSEQIIGWLGLDHVTGISLILRGITIALTFLAGWLLFAFIFFTLPGETTSVRSFMIGTTVGGLIIMLIQQLAGVLFSAFSGNAAATIFGPIIVLMLVFNTLATLILLIAACGCRYVDARYVPGSIRAGVGAFGPQQGQGRHDGRRGRGTRTRGPGGHPGARGGGQAEAEGADHQNGGNAHP